MNPNVPIEIQEKWPQYDFIGFPFDYKDGRRLVRAYHKTLLDTHYYSFEEDVFWLDYPEHCWLNRAK